MGPGSITGIGGSEPTSSKHCMTGSPLSSYDKFMKWFLLVSAWVLCWGLEIAHASVVQGERYKPSDEEVQRLIEFAAGERKEGAILLSFIRTASYHVPNAKVDFYSVAWPAGRTSGPLRFFESAQCTVQDGVFVPCLGTSHMARWAGGGLFRYEGPFFDAELVELLSVVTEFFHAEALINEVKKEPSRNAANWRTGRHQYRVLIGSRLNPDVYQFVRECETIDRCEWGVKRLGRIKY